MSSGEFQGPPPAGAAPVRPDQASLSAGLLLGLVSLAGWSAYLIVARHGALVGFQPFDLAVARLAPAGIIFLPLILRRGVGNLGGVGWRRGIILAMFGGPSFAFLMAGGFTFAPVTHGSVVGPATLTLMTTLLAISFLGDRPTALRYLGLAAIVAGIVLVGITAFQTAITGTILLGDFFFFIANVSFAIFTILLRKWEVPALPGAAAVTGISALVMLPIYAALADYANLEQIGLAEFALQWLGQGVFTGCIATVCFMAAVQRIGPARAAVFPSAIPASGVLLGGPLLGESTNTLQLIGVAVTTLGLVMAIGLADQWFRRR